MAYAYFISLVLIWSVSFLLMKKATLCFAAASVGAWRVFAGAVVVIAVWRWRRGRLTLKRKQIVPLLLVIVLRFVIPFTIQPALVVRVGSGTLGMCIGFVPLATVMVSVPILGVYPSRLQLIGILGALISLGVLMIDRMRWDVSPRDMSLAITVPLLYATANTIVRRWLANIPSLEMVSLSLAGSSILLSPALALPQAPAEAPISMLRTSVVAMLFLGIISTGFASVMFNRLIRERGPLFAGMSNNLVPVGAVIAGWLDAEPVSLLQTVALGGVVAMVAIVQIASRPPSYQTSEVRGTASNEGCILEEDLAR
jgi:drug/metabolite transporter (DMT)-like permease